MTIQRGIQDGPQGNPDEADTRDRPTPWLWDACDFEKLRNGFGGRALYLDGVSARGLLSVDTIGTGSPTLTYPSTDKGEILLTQGGAAAGDGGQVYLGASNIGAPFAIPASGRLWFEARVKISQIATPQQVFVGLSQIGASGSGGLMTQTTAAGQMILQGLGFKTASVTATAAIGSITQNSTSESGNSEINAGVKTLVADTYVKFGIQTDTYVNGVTTVQRARFYVDGVLVATHTTKIPTAVLTPSFALYASNTNAATTMSIAWIRVAVEDVAGAD